jgi:aminoglycoside/choline kinase family phosphotransferase
MCSNDFVPLREEFQKIAELIASQPRVFTHRDYHSRNLMVHGNQIGLLDFQDALMGPAAYDLASLLRDAYIQLDDELVEELVMRYITGMPKGSIGDVDDFRRIFDFTSIQRNLKAAGRFVYIDRIKRNPKFLADIPRTLGYVRTNLQKYPELKTLHTHLAPYVPELA